MRPRLNLGHIPAHLASILSCCETVWTRASALRDLALSTVSPCVERPTKLSELVQQILDVFPIEVDCDVLMRGMRDDRAGMCDEVVQVGKEVETTVLGISNQSYNVLLASVFLYTAFGNEIGLDVVASLPLHPSIVPKRQAIE